MSLDRKNRDIWLIYNHPVFRDIIERQGKFKKSGEYRLGNTEFIVKVPNNAGNKPMSEGAKVNVGWKAADCRALDPLS